MRLRRRRMTVEEDPLAAIRVELLNATHRLNVEEREREGAERRRELRRTRRARRMRRFTVVAASAVLAVGAAAGAQELGADLPLVERLLERIQSGEEDNPSGSIAPADVRPGAGNIAEPLPIRAGDAGDGAAAAYFNRGGHICFVIAERDQTGGVSGCFAPEVLARRLATEDALVSDVRRGDVTVVTGYAAAGVEGLTVTGPSGEMRVVLGGPWSPPSSGIAALRPFIAIGEVDEIVDPRAYSIKIRTGSDR